MCIGNTRYVISVWPAQNIDMFEPTICLAHMRFRSDMPTFRLHSHRGCTLFPCPRLPSSSFDFFSVLSRLASDRNRFGTRWSVLHAVPCHTRERTRKSNFHRETYYRSSREYDVLRETCGSGLCHCWECC